MTAPRAKRPRETGTLLGVRLQSDALGELDVFIASQPEPHPSRPEAIRRLLREALAGKPHLAVTSAELSREIHALESEIAKIPEPSERSPDGALQTMDKAIAETALTGLRTRRKQLRKAKSQ